MFNISLKDIYFAISGSNTNKWTLTGQPNANLICEDTFRYAPFGAKSLNGADFDYANTDVLTTDVRVKDGYDDENIEEIRLVIPSDTSQHVKNYSILRADPQINFDIVSGIPTNAEVHFVDGDDQDITSQMTGKISAYIMTREAYAQTGDQTLHDIALGRYVLLVQTESNASSLVGEDFSLVIKGTDKNGNEFVNDYGAITINLTAPAPERAGLYGSSEAYPTSGGTLIKSWSSLVSDGNISVDNNYYVSVGENALTLPSYNGYRIEVPDNIRGFDTTEIDSNEVKWCNKIFNNDYIDGYSVVKLPDSFTNHGTDSQFCIGPHVAVVYNGDDSDKPYGAQILNPIENNIGFDQLGYSYNKSAPVDVAFTINTTPALNNNDTIPFSWIIDTSNYAYKVYSDVDCTHEIYNSGIVFNQTNLGGSINGLQADNGTYYIKGFIKFKQMGAYEYYEEFDKTFETNVVVLEVEGTYVNPVTLASSFGTNLDSETAQPTNTLTILGTSAYNEGTFEIVLRNYDENADHAFEYIGSGIAGYQNPYATAVVKRATVWGGQNDGETINAPAFIWDQPYFNYISNDKQIGLSAYDPADSSSQLNKIIIGSVNNLPNDATGINIIVRITVAATNAQGDKLSRFIDINFRMQKLE